MNKLTQTVFFLIIFTMIRITSFAQETELPTNEEMIRLMRQYGINPASSGTASAMLPQKTNSQHLKVNNEDGSRAAYQLFDNGPFVTHPGGGTGGADFSMTYSPYQQNGYQATWPGWRITDDFVVTGNERWTIESIRLFAYQSTSPTSPSPIKRAFIQIWDAAPNAGGTLIWGDMVTNRMTSTSWSNCYRGTALTQTNRPVMKVDCATPGLELEPGTYWIDYTFEGNPSYGSAAIVPVTISGQPVTGNGYTTFNGGMSWSWLGTVVYQQGAPFKIFGYQGDPQAPEAIDDFTVTPAAMGALSAGLAWTNPSLTQSGDPLTSLTSVSIYRDDVLIYENTSPGIGAAEAFTDTPAQPGLYYYEIISANASGNSPKVGLEVYVGEDVPAAPTNVTLTPVNDNIDGQITWDDPTEGLHGAYYTGFTGFTIIRMPDSTVLATNWSGTQPFVDNTIPAFGYYTYRVIAVNAIGNGGIGISNGELLGPFVYTKSAYANNFATHEFVSVDVITGKQTFIADNTFDPASDWPKETVATYANGVYYVGDAVNKSLFIKTDDGTEVPLGPIELNGEPLSPTGLAYDETTSTMYIGVLSTSTYMKSLCTIDLSTLELTVITSQSIIYDMTFGLVFLPDGFLYTINTSSETLVKINPATGAQMVVGNIGFNADGWQALSYEPTLNRIYTYTHGLAEYDRYGYYNINTGLFTPLTNDLEAYNTGFIIKDPLVLADVDAVAFYVETPEVVKHKFGVGETTPVKVKVGNYGLSSATFDVTLEIGDDYSETISVSNLGSVQETEIVFPNWTPIEAGAHNLILTVSDPGGDGNLENNTVSRVVDVYDGCRHTLILYAPWGDDWWGDWAQVFVNWEPFYEYITKPVGDPYELPVYAEEGDEITFIYYGDGLYNEEHSWELLDGEGNQLFAGSGTEYNIEQSATANCPPNPDANFLSFSFNTAENPSLFGDVVGVIDPETYTITLDVLENVNVSSLVATFTLSGGAVATVKGVGQESGVTANNFTNPVVYNVTAEAGNTQNWTVTINTLPCLNPWSYVVTSSIHTISIPLTAAPEIFGLPLAAYDWIGVFFLNDNGVETCAGAVQWTGTGNVAIIAYGNDPTTPEKDGFASGESFRWRLSQCGNPVDYTAAATYDPSMPNQGNFTGFGLSKLTSLKAAHIQYFTLNQGWNGISSCLVPIDPAVQNMFAPIVNKLTILGNLTSVYWPSQGVNTIGNWNSNSGYAAKVTENVDFMIYGDSYANGTMTIPAGWSYLPVHSQCAASVMDMFSGNLSNVVIIQDLIGTQIFWPQFGVYTLEAFEPGKTYKIKLASAVTVTFPDCDQKASTQLSPGISKISTIWGELDYSPENQVTAILESALLDFQNGDLVGAFNTDGLLCGYLKIGAIEHNLAITLFGNDQFSLKANGLTNGEPVYFKLYRSNTGEWFDMEVVYDPSMENSTGNYRTETLAAITNIILKSTGITEMNPMNYSITPNPAKEIITITAANGANQFVEALIYDMHGTLLIENGFQKQTSLSIGNLKSGVYMVVLRTAYHYEVQKLVIQ